MNAMQGAYVRQGFPLPSVTPVAAAADLLCAGLTVQQNPKTLKGAVIPMRRLQGGYLGADAPAGGSPTFSITDPSTWLAWVEANPLMAGGIVIGGLWLLGKRRGR